MEDSKTSNFPYKTLIWALLAALALFLFKPELKGLLTNAEKVSLFGIEINASKQQVKKLQDSIQSFETEIASLSNQIAKQEHEIHTLDRLKAMLENDLSNCPSAQESATKLSTQLDKIKINSTNIITKSDKLKNVDILRRSSFVKQ